MRQWNRLNLSSRLRHKVSIYHRGTATEPNELGVYPITDVEVGKVWCNIIPQSGGLLNGRLGDTILTRTTHKFIMRPNKYVMDNSYWLVYKGQRYDILYVQNPFEENEYLEVFTACTIP